MSRLLLNIIFFLICYFPFIAIVVFCQQNDDVAATVPVPVLVISIESFRWNFVDRIRRLKNATDRPSHLWDLIANGTYAPDGIISTFSTTTIPNQYSAVTGLYQESHGIISELLHDQSTGDTIDLKLFGLPTGGGKEFGGGEPIWRTLRRQQQGQQENTLLVGCHGWFACKAGGNDGVNRSVLTNQYADWKSRIDEVIQWLKDGLRLVLVSVPDIDAVGRLEGPESTRMDEALIQVDAIIGYLAESIKKELSSSTTSGVNLIIMSGHGITAAKQPAAPILPPDLARFFRIWTQTPTIWLVEPKEYNESESIAYLSKFPNLRVFAKRDIPDEWHYKGSPYVAPILIVAEPGYVLSDGQKGLYGYNNSFDAMRGSFIAHGPAFAANSRLPCVASTVDLYQLLCALLDIVPAPNNGSIKNIEPILSPSFASRLTRWTRAESAHSWIPVIILCIILVAGILAAAWLWYRYGGDSGNKAADDSNYSANQKMLSKYDSEPILLELEGGGGDKP